MYARILGTEETAPRRVRTHLSSAGLGPVSTLLSMPVAVPPRRRALAAIALVATTALAGCTGGDSEGPDDAGTSAPPPTTTPTPLPRFDTSVVTVARGDFCDLVPRWAIEQALDGRASSDSTYADGDRAEVVPGTTDVAHEYSCRWKGPNQRIARAWVFAPPVARSQAKVLVEGLGKQQGCRAVDDAPAFGKPTIARICTAGGATTASFAGLFVDAWLSCSLYQGPKASDRLTDGELLDRAGEWCVQVASAVNTSDTDPMASSSASSSDSSPSSSG